MGNRGKPHVLVVDDERDIANMLCSYFQLAGLETEAAFNGPAAIAAARRDPDIVLLDVNLPGCDGFSVCREIRETVTCPIIFLTARLEDADMIEGFAAGGDDYVTKPFSLDVLGARVKAQLSREERRAQQNRALIRYGEHLAVDFAGKMIRVDGEEVPLPRKEFEIVELLAKRPGQVFDRAMIYELVWGKPGDSTVVTEHIRRLRRALEAAGLENDPIKTIWGMGYTWRPQ